MEEQTIFRVVKDGDNPYVMINKESAQDEGISWKARGILIYLLSLPDDWRIYESELAKHAPDGKASLKSGIKELIKAGYIERKRIRNERGHFKGYEYCVYEVSTESRLSDNGLSVNGKSATTNNDLTKYLPKQYDNKGVPPEALPYVNLYFALYSEAFRKRHPYISREQMLSCENNIQAFADDMSISPDGVAAMICRYFDSNFTQGTDYNINHFATEGVMMNRFYEELY